MHISNIQNRSVSFGSWVKLVHGKNPEDLLYRTSTAMFKNGSEIPNIVDELVQAYQGVDRVNTYFFGCSNGCESTTFRIFLGAKYGEWVAKKFSPITAIDIEESAIKKAVSRIYAIDGFEYYYAQQHTGGKFEKYFKHAEESPLPQIGKKNWISFMNNSEKIFDKVQIAKYDEIEVGMLAKLKEQYAKDIKYRKGNIITDWKIINPENPVVFARNFWTYLEEYIPLLAEKLSEKLKHNGRLIIGKYDNLPESYKKISSLNNILLQNNFSRVENQSFYMYKRN